MPINQALLDFTDNNISDAPDTPGVYGLYYADRACRYYGSGTVSIRTRLQAHKRGDEGNCTKIASFYNWELSSTPLSRERQLLREYQEQYGKLPLCNEVNP